MSRQPGPRLAIVDGDMEDSRAKLRGVVQRVYPIRARMARLLAARLDRRSRCAD
jgi:hypothetical protein